jgi:predicted lipoprotein with Yx(FWY)xxD motif
MRALAITAMFFALAGAAAAAPVVKTAYNAHLKTTILVDGRGHTLYMWTPDTGGHATCLNDSTYHCSKHWIPVYGTSATVAGAAKQSLIGTVQRGDGTTQITYKQWPLYTWIGGYGTKGDKKPGDVFGQGFVAVWFVLSPKGTLIKKLP